MNAITPPIPVSSATLSIRKLQPTIGAEIEGVDLRETLNDATRDAIRAAVVQHKVVFFRGQHLSAQQHADFARRFGTLYHHPTTSRSGTGNEPALHRISATEDKERFAQRRSRTVKWDAYHTDTSWRLVPAWGAILRAVTLPELGGDTIWVDAGLAYRGLPAELQERLQGLHVTHDYRDDLTRSGHDYPIVAHPVVRTHRETGEAILWVNYSQHPQILGLELAESRALLEQIIAQYQKPENQVRFSWQPGSVAFWDNRAAVHYAVRNYGDFPRSLDRILIADAPLYADL